MPNIIRDGYTQRGYIAAVDGLHDAVQFEYRPMLPEEVEFTEAEVNRIGGDPKKAVRLVAAQVQRHLVSWDQKDADAKDADITFDNVRRLRYPVLNKLYKIIAGLVASDPLPGGTERDERDEVTAIIAEAAGQPPGHAALEAAEKN